MSLLGYVVNKPHWMSMNQLPQSKNTHQGMITEP